MTGAARLALGDALGLYVHWPYCARICPYCDFNVYRPKGNDETLLAAILDDMAHWRTRSGARRLVSLHFGGGTPSLMTPVQLAAVIETADRLWGFETGAEIGLEANPRDMDGFADMAAAGINRLSLGVQSFDDAALAALGRDHDSVMGQRSIDAAQAAFRRVSVDMIYARAGQDAAAWEAELRRALATGVGHVSPYQLTIEPQTAFGKRAARGEKLAAAPDFAADLYELTHAVCEAEGLAAYEISNHARTPGDRSVHNRLYWAGGDWIGVGPGAHGRIGRAAAGGRLATEAHRRPRDYIDADPRYTAETLGAADEGAERILMGMRVADGLDLVHLEAATGAGVDPGGLARMSRQGFVEQDGTHIRLTREGRLLADGVSGELVP
ncbi:radical SAM family heme chaperone HemW [Maricaulis sp.]|uniref:radical SAM family heme chaperone HemW n=1 Tax=Maricaulis sp. TaxID=1486257 RepID=UPI00261A0CAF|nr:radical SAM family heme chaperone HemW [Maricaulis sp.]